MGKKTKKTKTAEAELHLPRRSTDLRLLLFAAGDWRRHIEYEWAVRYDTRGVRRYAAVLRAADPIPDVVVRTPRGHLVGTDGPSILAHELGVTVGCTRLSWRHADSIIRESDLMVRRPRSRRRERKLAVHLRDYAILEDGSVLSGEHLVPRRAVLIVSRLRREVYRRGL